MQQKNSSGAQLQGNSFKFAYEILLVVLILTIGFSVHQILSYAKESAQLSEMQSAKDRLNDISNKMEWMSFYAQKLVNRVDTFEADQFNKALHEVAEAFTEGTPEIERVLPLADWRKIKQELQEKTAKFNASPKVNPYPEISEELLQMGDSLRLKLIQRTAMLSYRSKSLGVLLVGETLLLLLGVLWGRRTSLRERDRWQAFSNVLSESQKHLVMANVKAQAADLAKTDFLNHMSHEIRTPLNAVSGLANLLTKTPLSNEQKPFVEGIQKAAVSLLELVNSVLDFAKIENSGLNLVPEPQFLQSILSDVRSIWVGPCEAKGLKFKLEAPTDIPKLLIDSLRLKQVLMNLLGNAVKFAAEGEIVLRVQKLSAGDANKLRFRIEVQDEGPGIPVEAQEKLFAAFYQTDSTPARKYGGTGLGLSISKTIVEAMQGKIGFQSKPELDKGSIFWIEVSLQIDPTSSQIWEEKLAPSMAGQTTNIQSHFSGRALIIEDNPLNQMVLKGHLLEHGLTCEMVDTGRGALELLKRDSRFDLIFLDCQLPEMDGFEVTRRLRAEEHGKNLILVATTAHAISGYRERCLREGMNDYLSKPLDPAKLLSVISTYLKPTTTTQIELSQTQSSEVLLLQAPVPVVAPEMPILDKQKWSRWNPQFKKEMIELFMSISVEKLGEMEERLAHQDLKAVSEAGHFLKSSCYDIGAKSLGDICAKIEAGETVPDVSDLVQEFRRLHEKLQAELKAELSQPSAA